MAEPSEVEERFEERFLTFDTARGSNVRGYLKDEWLSDTHQVRLRLEVEKWPRDGKEWTELARFVQYVDCAFRDFLNTHAEMREREAQDDIPF